MIPNKDTMAKTAKEEYGQSTGKEVVEYLAALFGAVTAAWEKWQSNIKFGGTIVKGSGVGAWTGTGSEGILQGGSYKMEDFEFKGNSPQQKKFSKALGDTLTIKFKLFLTTYKITKLTYSGSSGASNTSPGPVSASCAGTPLKGAGEGTNLSGIADDWMAILRADPDFNIDNPACKSKGLIAAIAKVIEREFQLTWLSTAKLVNNKLSATGAPGGVVPGTKTGMDGVIS